MTNTELTNAIGTYIGNYSVSGIASFIETERIASILTDADLPTIDDAFIVVWGDGKEEEEFQSLELARTRIEDIKAMGDYYEELNLVGKDTGYDYDF